MSSYSHIKIRKMNPGDREAIRQICCDTGYGGNSIEGIFDDPELFADLWCSYYTDLEPESTLVAETEGRVVGYLLGCLDTARYNKIFSSRIVPKFLGRALTGRYRIRRKTIRYFHSQLRQLLRREVQFPPLELYPAHLHINIDAEFRRVGVGHMLMSSYFAYLRKNGIKGLHLGTTSLHTTALPFYKKIGFTEHSRVNTTFLGKPMANITYVKEIEPRNE